MDNFVDPQRELSEADIVMGVHEVVSKEAS
jgi:hypothetical protein